MSRFISSPAIRLGLGLALLLIAFSLALGFQADTLPYAPEAQFSDASISRWPDALHFQRSLREDKTLPLWNPHLMGGQPFAANPGAKVWYPLTWLLLIWDVALHINALTIFHLWLAGLGMWFWAREMGLQGAPLLLATFGYALAPKLIAHSAAGHLDLLIAAAWWPWLFYGLKRLIHQPTPFNVAGVACTAALIFIGAIQLLPYVYGLSAAYALFLLYEAYQNKINLRPRFGALALSGLFAIGLTAAVWLPLLELREAVSRGDISKTDAALFSLEPGLLFGWLIGQHGGAPETMTSVGLSLFLLAIIGLLIAPRKNWAWWLALILALLYAFGEFFPLWGALFDLLPPLRWFRVPSRAYFIAALLLPYLAGWGLQQLSQNPPHSARARLMVVGLFGFGLTCTLASFVILRETEIKTSALIGLAVLPLAALLLALVIFERLRPEQALILFLLLGLVDLLWIDRTLIEGRARSEWLNEIPPAPIAHLAETGGRIYTPDYAIPQQDTAYWGIARFDGVDPFQLGEFVAMAEQATGVPREGYSTTVPAVVVLEDDEDSHIYKAAPLDPDLLGAWGVAWVVTGYEIDNPDLVLRAEEDGLFFYENMRHNPALRLHWPSPNRYEQSQTDLIDAAYNQTLSEILIADAPGWVDNEYRPRGVIVGALVSGFSLLLMVLGLGVAWTRRLAV